MSRMLFYFGISVTICARSDAAKFTGEVSNEAVTFSRDSIECTSSCGGNPKCKGFAYNNSTCHHYNDDLPHNNAGILDIPNVWIKECPENFVSGIYRLQCYLNVNDIYNWTEAKGICESKNSYLAELVEHEEREAVWNYFKGTVDDPRKYRWVGILQVDPNAVGKVRNYKWVRSGQNVPGDVSYWANRFVPSSSGPEACGAVGLATSNNKFHDHYCYNYHGFICEW